MEKQKHSVFLAILAAFFIIGIFLGSFASARVTNETSDYLDQFISTAFFTGGNSAFPIGQALIHSFLFPAAVFVLSFTIFGAAAIPLAIAARSFSLSFAVASFIRSFGSKGLLLAFGALGPQNLLTLPCLLILAAQGMLSSLAVLAVFTGKAKKAGGFYGKHAFLRAAACLAVLAAAALLEVYVVPPLFSALAVNI